ncbi:MAG: site-2 protease family protein [Chloracidobacterium sp.]|nr:site-2 protease family protein [Chloracidobacterium sp.]
MESTAVQFISGLVIYMVIWLFSVSAHEAAHAWTSWKFEDDTAYLLGRVTLNPIPHIDPIGTLLLPIIGYAIGFYSGAVGVPLIMWGKPTPVNPLKWRKKDLANVCVSLAGITVNLLIAIAATLVLKGLIYGGVITRANLQDSGMQILVQFIYGMIVLNIGLAIFNLLPFPPLDGSKALQSLLPSSFEPIFNILETYGFLILLILLQIGVINRIVQPLFGLIFYLLGL